MIRLRSFATAIWLIVPILVLNIVFAKDLPAAFQPDVFWSAIPGWIALPENVLRTAVFAATVFMPFRGWRDGAGTGWALFLLGNALYALAWAALILWPQSAWSASALGFAAPAWTPAIWLAGIALVSGPPSFATRWGAAWAIAFRLSAVGFLAAHISHTLLVHSRLAG
jgi:hypothetical protein